MQKIRIPILTVQNFEVSGESKLEIDSFCINSINVDHEEMQDFLAFEVKDNKYVVDHLLEKISEIHLNGELNLLVKVNMQKFFWSPFYSSDKRNDFVYDNRLVCSFVDADGCFRNHDPMASGSSDGKKGICQYTTPAIPTKTITMNLVVLDVLSPTELDWIMIKSGHHCCLPTI